MNHRRRRSRSNRCRLAFRTKPGRGTLQAVARVPLPFCTVCQGLVLCFCLPFGRPHPMGVQFPLNLHPQSINARTSVQNLAGTGKSSERNRHHPAIPAQPEGKGPSLPSIVCSDAPSKLRIQRAFHRKRKRNTDDHHTGQFCAGQSCRFRHTRRCHAGSESTVASRGRLA